MSGEGAVVPGPYGAPEHPDIVTADETVTVAVRVDGYPTAALPALFDTVFTGLFPALAEAGVRPAGPAYSLYTSAPAQTVDIEVGIPVDRVFEGEALLGTVPVGAGPVGAAQMGASSGEDAGPVGAEVGPAGTGAEAGASPGAEAGGAEGRVFELRAVASAVPGGRIAAATYLGGFDGLSGAWQTLVAALESQGETPAVPFWEVYVTEPRPDMDPAELRTDLFTALER
ncbi:AraC family transcriptional regulator [Brevibacterium salitolerans]|uniref:AraC effector-binding domain-containing protein n=1 Tax=Brevibacterium salitolerans TaxID=1403566 RepID=A0ABN2WJF9_9MICO